MLHARVQTAIFQLVVTSAIGLAFGFLGGYATIYHNRARSAYFHEPTPENERVFRAEQHRIDRMRLVGSLKDSALFFFLANCVYSAVARRRRMVFLSLLGACSVIVVRVGIPSLPLDRRCCSYGLPIVGWVSEGAAQAMALCAWLVALLLTVASFVWEHWKSSHAVVSWWLT